ncbi:hypothetical protein ACN47E_007991 [Coniothyrium glycines]
MVGATISGQEAQDLEIENVDVVIVGGGPTGLLCAVLAEQLGLSICLLDGKNGPVEVGGADALNPRTQQYLEVVGNAGKSSSNDTPILEKLFRKGVKCNTSTTYADGKITSQQSHWWNSIPHTCYNSFLMIGQPYIERVLMSKIKAPVHYSEPAISFSHNADSATSSGVTILTHKRQVKAKYCIAADGARSTMRNALGLGWEGTKPNMVWTVIDCWIDTTYPVSREIVALELNGQSSMAWIPRERGMQRFYLLIDGETSREKVIDSIRQHMAPHTVNVTHIEWLSKFEVKERVATSFVYPSSNGPFIIAGDAAHVHSVNGGQGLNTGLADAFSLMWRIGLMIKRPNLPLTLKSNLISSYDTERRATAKNVVDVAAQLVRSTKTEAKSYVALIEKNAGFITGMNVKYDGLHSPLVVESENNIFKAGHRCPDLWLQGSTFESSYRLYEKLIYGQYTLLLLGSQVSKLDVGEYDDILNQIHLRPLGKVANAIDNRGRCEEVDRPEISYGCSHVRMDDDFGVLVRPDTFIMKVGKMHEVLSCLQAVI